MAELPSPTITGPMGRAWSVPLSNDKPEWSGSVGVWLLESDKFHPAWTRWLVGLVHLRPIEGVRPAAKHFPSATHEFHIVSLNPEHYANHAEKLAGRFSEDEPWGFLTPIDVVEQFEVSADAIARQILDLAVRAILDGHASPDQDYRTLWQRLIADTAKHYRDGRHGLG